MTSRNEMILDTSAFFADTVHLVGIEKPVYLMMLVCMWCSPKGWVAEGALRAATGMDKVAWCRLRQAGRVFDLLIERKGEFSQKRILREIEAFHVVKPDAKKASAHIESNLLLRDSTSKNLPSLDSERIPRSQKTRTRTTLNEDWCIGMEELSYAKQHGFSQDQAQGMGQAFRDHHRAKGNRMADWSAAWRMWVRNEVKFYGKHQRNGGANGSKRGSLVDAWGKLSKWADQEAENSEGGESFGKLLPLGPVRRP